MKMNIQKLLLLLGASLFALGTVSCTEEKEHGHDHSHGDHGHGEEGHEHGGDDHDHGEHDHDHGDDDHDHAEGNHDHDDKEHGHDHAGGHDHDHGHAHLEAGPNGGRLITSVEPHLEFLITEDRKVKIFQVGDDDKAEPIGTQVVSLIGGDRSNPTRMNFDYDGDILISDNAFPAGMMFPVVLQIKASAGADAVTEKFNLDLNECPTCDSLEYACTCHH